MGCRFDESFSGQHQVGQEITKSFERSRRNHAISVAFLIGVRNRKMAQRTMDYIPDFVSSEPTNCRRASRCSSLCGAE